MANLNTTKIAHDLLGGQSQRLYHQDLMALENQRLKIDRRFMQFFGLRGHN